jgi:hypothetical protein
MFKYHHVFNTYIVATPTAALWDSAYSSRTEEHTAMIALALRLQVEGRVKIIMKNMRKCY